MKGKFIGGVICGGLIFGSIGVFAGQYTAVENPFPVQLNGNTVSIEGYNIDGNTYFKLRDIADIVGGFNVGFENNIIQLSKNGYSYSSVSTDSYGPTEIGTLSYEIDPSYEKYYGFPIYTDGNVYFVKLIDVNSVMSKDAGAKYTEMWMLTGTADKSHWRVEYTNVMNDDMYYNNMVYAMDGGILYHNDSENGYYITLNDYVENIKPYLGIHNGSPNSKFTYQKQSDVSFKD